MKELIQQIYKALYGEDLVQFIERPSPTPIIIPKTGREKLYEIALKYVGTDPTPQDLQSDEFACAEVVSTLLKKLLPDFPVLTFTPTLLEQLKKDNRFKQTNEFKEGNIIISPTLSGNGTVVGHVGIISQNGEILSNASSSGLWTNKYNNLSWVERYSRGGKLALYLFELVL